MKRIISYFVLLTLVLGLFSLKPSVAGAAPDCASVTLANDGFEQPVTVEDPKFDTIPGWRYFTWPLPDNYLLKVSDEQHDSGEKSLKIVNDGAQATGVYSEYFPINTACDYTVSSRVYLQQGGAIVYLKLYDTAGKEVLSSSQAITDPKDQWVEIKTGNPVPANAVKGRVLLYLPGNAQRIVYFDDVKVSVAPKFDVIGDDFLNPSFELPVVNGNIPGWKQIYGSGGITVSNTMAFDGTTSLQVDDRSGSTAYGLLSNRIHVTGGDIYKISAMLHMEGTNGMFLYFYDKNGTKIKEYVRGFDNLPKKQWGKVTLEGAAPKEATQMDVLLYSAAGNTGTAYFDNLSFVREKQLNIEFGSPIDHGTVVHVAQTPEAVVGANSKGEEFASFVVNGAPATFYAVEVATGNVLHVEKLPGIDTVWAMAKGSDGNIYFSGTSTGMLFRYLPDAMKIESLGKNPTGDVLVWALKASNDGKIYGGTYPGANLFEYDIATGQFHNFGNMKAGENYVRGVGVSGGYVYAGVGANAYLIQISRKTGEVRDIQLPNRGSVGMITDIDFRNGQAIIRAGIDKFYVMDEQTGVIVDTVTELYDQFSPPSPYNPDLSYFRKENDLYVYDWSTRTSRKLEGLPKQHENFGTIMFDWVEMSSGEKAGKKLLLGILGNTTYFLYDPEDHWYKLFKPNIPGEPVNLITLKTGPDGKLYTGAIYKAMSVYNPDTRQIEHEEVGIPQVEGVGIYNNILYFGTYPGAYIYRYDPAKPFEFSRDPSGNPGLVYQIGKLQDRPHAFASGGGKLFIGTKPTYGRLGGSLTVYDVNEDSWKEFGDLVHDQSIVGLEYKDGKLYGGTYIWGGLGVDPTQTEGKIFVWDVAQEKKITEFTPQIPGLTRTPESIGTVKFGPDGLLWGATEGAIFALDPVTYQVVKSKVIYDFHATYPIYLEWGDDGLLYTTLGRTLTVIDPVTLDYKMLKENVHIIALAPDGSIFYVTGFNASHLYQLPVKLGSATIASASSLIAVGAASQLQLTEAKLSNGKPANLTRAKVTYASSNPAVAAIVNDQIKGISEGTASIHAEVELDGSKVTTESIQMQVIIDTEAPVTSAVLDKDSPNGWYNSDVSVSLSATDNLPGALVTQYSLDGGVNWFAYTSPIVVSAEGMTEIKYLSIDASNNREEAKTVAINMDRTAPVFKLLDVHHTEFLNGAVYEDSLPISFTVNAIDNLSGMESTEITIDGLSYAQGSAYDLAGRLGNHTVEVTVTDHALNRTAASFTFHVETSLSSLSALVDKYTSSGELSGPLVPQLLNSLQQAQHHVDKGDYDQAAKHMENFLKHLNLDANESNISTSAKAVLQTDAANLITKWFSEN